MHFASQQIEVNVIIRQNPRKALSDATHFKGFKSYFFADNRAILLHAGSFSGQALLPDPIFIRLVCAYGLGITMLPELMPAITSSTLALISALSSTSGFSLMT